MSEPSGRLRGVRHALMGAFVEHWNDSARIGEVVFITFWQIAAVAVFAWLARQSGRGEVISSIAFGVVLMIIWRASVFRLGFMVTGANNQGTLELEMLSATPMFWIMLGKTFAAFVFYGLIGIACFGVVVAIGGAGVTVGNPLTLVVSLVVASIAVVALAYIFAPFTFLIGGQAGFFNAIFPIGILLSGFVQPTALLPPALEWPARLLPTAWATDALQLGLRGEPALTLLPRWAMSLVISAIVLGLTAWMFDRCEARIRETGLAQ